MKKMLIIIVVIVVVMILFFVFNPQILSFLILRGIQQNFGVNELNISLPNK